MSFMQNFVGVQGYGLNHPLNRYVPLDMLASESEPHGSLNPKALLVPLVTRVVDNVLRSKTQAWDAYSQEFGPIAFMELVVAPFDLGKIPDYKVIIVTQSGDKNYPGIKCAFSSEDYVFVIEDGAFRQWSYGEKPEFFTTFPLDKVFPGLVPDDGWIGA